MKYGQQLHEQSVPQWAPYNVDYDELKNLIKAQTTSSPGQAVAIPSQNGAVSQDFEESFFHEMTSQHDRVDLFVRSKSDEIHRRLEYLEKVVYKLISRPRPEGKPASDKRRQRFAKYDALTTRCLEDTRDLQHFVDAQRVAFHKILKKYRKWTGHRVLAERFNEEILGNIKSFLKRDFQPLLTQSSNLLTQIRGATPAADEETVTKKDTRQPRGSDRPKLTTRATSYWNEYDDADDANDAYAIYINPEESKESTMPGASAVLYIVSRVRKPITRFRTWLLPGSNHDDERTSLLSSSKHSPYYSATHSTTSDTDVEDTAASATSAEYPSLFQHYPSFRDTRLNEYQERALAYGALGSFVASFVLLVVASLLVATGRHKLRAEVDAGVVVGAVASLVFGALGLGATLYRRRELLGWLARMVVAVAFLAICLWDGILLVYVVGSSA